MITIFGLSVQASSLVNWGENSSIVTGTIIVKNGAGSTTVNPTTPSSPGVGTTYYTNHAGATPVFFSAAQDNLSAVQTGAGSAIRVVNNGTDTDMLRFVFADEGANHRSTALVIWKRYGSGSAGAPQYGFLNGGDDSKNLVTLDSLSVTAYANNQTGLTNRFVIAIGTNFYVSEALSAFAGTFATRSTVSIGDVSTANWYAYDPTSDIRTAGSLATITNFSNVSAVGFLYDKLEVNNVAVAPTFSISQFSANGTVVPEPMTVGMLGVDGMLTNAADTQLAANLILNALAMNNPAVCWVVRLLKTIRVFSTSQRLFWGVKEERWDFLLW